MHIHILGICGTFMGGLAALAREAGHTVTGCVANVYPPMSTQLEALGIALIQGFGAEQLALQALCHGAVTWQRLEELKRAGARGLMVLPVEGMLA